jgi:O-acetyl-ADP-ribose deacetylase
VFPAISCGVYAYPIKEAAKIAITECLKESFRDLEVTFCLFQSKDLNAFEEVYQQLS